MPKAKITKSSSAPVTTTTGSAERAPVTINTGGTPMWYKVIMLGLLILGLAWLVVHYLAGSHIPLFAELGAWNYAIGFGLFVLGLLMTMGWR